MKSHANSRITFPLQTAHPWHGVNQHKDCPAVIAVWVEVVPSDTLKFEVDKASGLMRLDRPQKYSSVCPAWYGFLPQSYCGARIAGLAGTAEGDGDPLDVLVLSDHSLSRNGFLCEATPIGGLRMIDNGQADDKIIAVLKEDPAFSHIGDLNQLPAALLDRILHYFSVYKAPPGVVNPVQIAAVYDRETAKSVIRASIEDYDNLMSESGT